MTKVGIRMTGDKELLAALRKRPVLMATSARKIVDRNGRQLKAQTMRNMASAYNAGYSKGNTKRSVDVVFSQAGLTATVAPHTDYFSYLEYGTRFMSPRPTLKPAFAYQRVKFVNDLRKLMK